MPSRRPPSSSAIDELAVDAVRCRGADGDHVVRGAEHPGGQGHRVGAEVEHRAAGEVGAHDPVVVVEPLPHVGQHRARLTERAPSASSWRTTSKRGRKRVHMASMQNTPAAGRGLPDAPRLPGVEPDRLLDEHVLAGRDGEQRVRQVQVVRRRDVDDVDLGVGDERLVGGVRRGRRPNASAARRAALGGRATRRPARPGGCSRAGRRRTCRRSSRCRGLPSATVARRGTAGHGGSAGATAYGMIAR